MVDRVRQAQPASAVVTPADRDAVPDVANSPQARSIFLPAKEEMNMPVAAQKAAALRRSELAIIHIAAKDLRLDRDTYLEIIWTIGCVKSSAQLDAHGRNAVIEHFKAKGWQSTNPKSRNRPPYKRASRDGTALASTGQVQYIRELWLALAAAGVVKNPEESALRAWVQSASRRYHPDQTGYSAPEFLPSAVARKLIEQLKSWATRCKVQLTAVTTNSNQEQ